MWLKSFRLSEKVSVLIIDELYKHFTGRGMEKSQTHRTSISQDLGHFKIFFYPKREWKSKMSHKIKFLKNINCGNFNCPLKSVAFS